MNVLAKNRSANLGGNQYCACYPGRKGSTAQNLIANCTFFPHRVAVNCLVLNWIQLIIPPIVFIAAYHRSKEDLQNVLPLNQLVVRGCGRSIMSCRSWCIGYVLSYRLCLFRFICKPKCNECSQDKIIYKSVFAKNAGRCICDV